MDPLTHVATGLIISQVIPLPSRAVGALAGIFFALLPDIDYLLTFSDRLAYLRHHRGFTHSILAVCLFALAAAAAGRLLAGPRWGRGLFVLGVAVLASHLLLDVATSYGTQLLSPVSRKKYALDWLFIIDPYLTGLLIIGAGSALWSAGWGRQVGIICLTLAGAYFLVCGFFHHQALKLAREVYGPGVASEVKIAALPQPLSCRRWQLLAAVPGEVRQTLVQLPISPMAASEVSHTEMEAEMDFGSGPRALKTPYQPPSHLTVYRWRSLAPIAGRISPEARRAQDDYLDFARFPVLVQMVNPPGGQRWFWLDLRFSVPGMPFPFVLSVEADSTGYVHRWRLGQGSGHRETD